MAKTEPLNKHCDDMVVEMVDAEDKVKEVIPHGKVLLEYLFSYLYKDEGCEEINQTLAGYFAKTVNAILRIKLVEVNVVLVN